MAKDTIARALYREGHRVARRMNSANVTTDLGHEDESTSPFIAGFRSWYRTQDSKDDYHHGFWLLDRYSDSRPFWGTKLSAFWTAMIDRQTEVELAHPAQAADGGTGA